MFQNLAICTYVEFTGRRVVFLCFTSTVFNLSNILTSNSIESNYDLLYALFSTLPM